MTESYVDAIYEAAVVPGRWPSVLGAVAASVDAKGGLIVAGAHGRTTWLASAAVEDIYEKYLAGGWHKQDDRLLRVRALRHPGFVTSADVTSEQERAAVPLFTAFLEPHGFDASAGTTMPALAGDAIQLSIEAFSSHSAARAALPALDRLRPHLARAGMLATRLGLERAQVAVGAMAQLGAPAAILGRGRRLVAANNLFECWLGLYYHDTPTGLRLADAAADVKLGTVIASLASRLQPESGSGSFPIAGIQGQPRLVMHVLPVQGVARDIFALGTAILIVTLPGVRAVAGADLIQNLLDLTPAEARLAQHMAAGLTLAEAAIAARIQQNTARTQLKSIFAKTGLSRQADLRCLIASIAPPIRGR